MDATNSNSLNSIEQLLQNFKDGKAKLIHFSLFIDNSLKQENIFNFMQTIGKSEEFLDFIFDQGPKEDIIFLNYFSKFSKDKDIEEFLQKKKSTKLLPFIKALQESDEESNNYTHEEKIPLNALKDPTKENKIIEFMKFISQNFTINENSILKLPENLIDQILNILSDHVKEGKYFDPRLFHFTDLLDTVKKHSIKLNIPINIPKDSFKRILPVLLENLTQTLERKSQSSQFNGLYALMNSIIDLLNTNKNSEFELEIPDNLQEKSLEILSRLKNRSENTTYYNPYPGNSTYCKPIPCNIAKSCTEQFINALKKNNVEIINELSTFATKFNNYAGGSNFTFRNTDFNESQTQLT